MTSVDRYSSASWVAALAVSAVACIGMAVRVRVDVTPPPAPHVASNELAPCDTTLVEQLAGSAAAAALAVHSAPDSVRTDMPAIDKLLAELWDAQSELTSAELDLASCRAAHAAAHARATNPTWPCEDHEVDRLQREWQLLYRLYTTPAGDNASRDDVARRLFLATDRYEYARWRLLDCRERHAEALGA